MGLTAAFQIGRSALTASQIAMQVTGNNFANASTPGYSRQVASFGPIRDAQYGGLMLGRGVSVMDVRRQTDTALQARLNGSYSQESLAQQNLQLMSTVENLLNELSDTDISSELSRFFNTWSELANSPASSGARAVVVQQGQTLASFIRTTRDDLVSLRGQVDGQLDSAVSRANDLLTQIADMNRAIVDSEGGQTTANGLRDQRDQLIQQISQQMDVSVVEQANGTVDVLVGSVPVVLAGRSLGLQVKRENVGNEVRVRIATRDPAQDINVTSGVVGSLVSQRSTLVNGTIDKLDSLASQLIFQVNRVHSVGYSGTPLTSVRGTQNVAAGDTTRSLNDPANSTFSALPFRAVNGGFTVTVKNESTGALQTVRIDVDLDGIDSTGAAGFGDDTSVQDIATQLSAIPNLNAGINPDGTLSINSATGFSFSFSDDSSGALAVLGVNTYFTGADARDISVRQSLIDTPSGLNAGALNASGQPVDNGSAMAIAGLQDQANNALGGKTIRGVWLDAVQSIASRTDAARTRADATTLVRENLEAQRSAISGVSLDEESINMITFQQQYQGAARFITAVNEMTQTLLNLVS